MIPPEPITDKEILSYLLKKKFFPKKNIQIITPNISTVALLNIIECYLTVSGVTFSWKDYSNTERKSSFLESVLQIQKDLFSWLSLYNSVVIQVDKYSKKTVEFYTVSNLEQCLFLRTDHWFGVKSGGSVGHLEGVITGFRSNDVRTSIVSSDFLTGVDSKVDFRLITPDYSVGANIPEIPDLLYNIQLQQSSSTVHSINPSFVYQRYSLGNYFGIYLKYKHKIPFVCEYNGSFVWMAEKWNGRKLLHNNLMLSIEMLNLQHSDVIVVVSSVMKEELIERGIDGRKILVNPNGVHPNVYSPVVESERIKNMYNLQNKFVFGFLGTFGPWHGAEVLTKAFGLLLRKYPEIKDKVVLMLVGDGKTMHQVNESIIEFFIENSVLLTGLVPQAEGPEYLSACDVLVSPHIQNPDHSRFFGSPTKLFEYMSMNKPIIASDLEQIGDILEHNKTALLTEPGNIEQLISAMYSLYQDTELRSSLGNEARKEVISNYSWHDHTKKILTFLKKK